LGQNYLSDQNYVLKICDAFQDDSEGGHRVVEIGPGMGALTRVLMRKYPKMTAIEIDERSVRFLNEKLPGLNVLNQDIMKFDWGKLAVEKGGKLNVVANLPYYITSQVLFGLADAHRAINKAVVTMQWEVGERITAQPSTKDYGIPSVVFQLYGKTHLNFKIPPSVFFPVPKVDSALVTIDFSQPHKNLHLVEGVHLRRYKDGDMRNVRA
jgi:ribosomal RNA small subunit methyltransferase A